MRENISGSLARHIAQAATGEGLATIAKARETGRADVGASVLTYQSANGAAVWSIQGPAQDVGCWLDIADAEPHHEGGVSGYTLGANACAI